MKSLILHCILLKILKLTLKWVLFKLILRKKGKNSFPFSSLNITRLNQQKTKREISHERTASVLQHLVRYLLSTWSLFSKMNEITSFLQFTIPTKGKMETRCLTIALLSLFLKIADCQDDLRVSEEENDDILYPPWYSIEEPIWID